MSKKISKEEFLSRFRLRHPQAEIEVVKYSAISKPATIKCLKCGKVTTEKNARRLLDEFNCCGYVSNRTSDCDKDRDGALPGDIQAQFNAIFQGKIRMLKYCGLNKPGYYKCAECGKVFTKNYSLMLESKGCPICKQFTSFKRLDTDCRPGKR